LNLDQVRELRLPPNPAKETDARFAHYLADTDVYDSWELDALSPSFIDELVENAIRKLVEEEAWSKALERERVNKDLLNRMARSFARPGGAPP